MRTMNSIKFALLPVLLLFLPLSQPEKGGENISSEVENRPEVNSFFADCSLDNRAFSSGERVVYTVYYKLGFIWLSAGTVTFTVEEDDNYYHMEAFGRTSSTYDRIFRVRDRYTSKVDKYSLLPVHAVRDIEEGSYRKYAELSFDYNSGFIKAKHGRNRDKLELDTLEMDRCMHDVLSIIYYSRNMNVDRMNVNDVIDLAVTLDDKTYNVGMRYEGLTENKRIRRAGRFDLLEFTPQVIAGNVFEEGDEMTVWVSNDRNRIPVMIESPLTVGSIRVVLDEYDGLRHPLASMR